MGRQEHHIFSWENQAKKNKKYYIWALYFKNIFNSNASEVPPDFLNGFPSMISEEMNNSMSRPVSQDEIKKLSSLYINRKLIVAEKCEPYLNSTDPESSPSSKSGRPTSYKFVHYILQDHLENLVPETLASTSSDYRNGKKSSLALKLGISKAYDRVEWAYLAQVLKVWGFNNTFTAWILECVTTVSYSILVNGESCDYFKPSRGLRQGDPLSPLVFVLCDEGLSHKLNQATTTNIIRGIQIARHAPPISHLFFADDPDFHPRKCLFSQKPAQYSDRVWESQCAFIPAILKVQNVSTESTYLGLPPYIMRFKQESFKAIPIYTMMFFKLPRTLCDRINSLMAQFWWGSTKNKKKISWVVWRKICRSKWNGGLGFKDFNAFNQALLAKQVWRISHHQDSLRYKIFKSKYFLKTNIWHAPLKSNSSWGWRSLWHGLKLINQGRRWQIANGSHIHTLTNPWIPTKTPFMPKPKPTTRLFDIADLVLGLIDKHTNNWDDQLISHLFIEEDVSAILAIPLPISPVPDRIVWHHHNTGLFTVKSGYYTALSVSQEDEPPLDPLLSRSNWRSLWELTIPNKIKIFIWRVLVNGLSTAENLDIRLEGNMTCPRYGAQESRNHLFSNVILSKGYGFTLL
ncbi:uncharacterized protein LOC126681681 [Mercurialis annua]|uniref:uncharacterized protein LOC126681681 n=1 Tax=Mercurialis annua TaxID=3986 RepID=UPI00215E765F|nr:uncharacterized protein LOC126681681 [Mercurialis annua]